MIILGVSGGVARGNQDAAAALLVDGELVFAQEEERFSLDKHAVGALPEYSTAAALSYAGLDMRDVDYIAFHAEYYNLRENLERYFRHIFGHCPPIRFVNHHRAHAASAYFASGWDEAMVFTTDLSGDGISTTLSHAVGNDINLLRKFEKPQSLGVFYSLITQILGFRRDNDEYKVMGMASYGEPVNDLSWLMKVEPGHYEINEECLVKLERGSPNPSKQEPLFSDTFADSVGWERRKTEPYAQQHFDLAASAQFALNEAARSLVLWLHQQTGSRRLCVAGGVGLNCAMNRALLAMDEVDEVFVQPASSDSGNAVGAAYLVAIEEGESLAPFPGVMIGNEFTPGEIRDVLDTLGAPYREVDDPADAGAEAVAEGKILGWFQGRHEFGPRALGCRSIVGDPRLADMKDRINHSVKFREEFRPFAPSVLLEHADEYFVTDGVPYPYMTVNCDARPERADRVPSIVHVDGTSRVQTVEREANGLYHDLISGVARRTDVPVVLNTSFNVKGQTIVNTPTHAISTLFGSGMDIACIGPFVITKPRSSSSDPG